MMQTLVCDALPLLAHPVSAWFVYKGQSKSKLIMKYEGVMLVICSLAHSALINYVDDLFF